MTIKLASKNPKTSKNGENLYVGPTTVNCPGKSNSVIRIFEYFAVDSSNSARPILQIRKSLWFYLNAGLSFGSWGRRAVCSNVKCAARRKALHDSIAIDKQFLWGCLRFRPLDDRVRPRWLFSSVWFSQVDFRFVQSAETRGRTSHCQRSWCGSFS